MTSSKQVQKTNDSCSVSKLSSANAGYFEDPCLQIFVGKKQKRSAIINRGYYIRFKAMEMALESWFAQLSSSNQQTSQIISLGAGFDSNFFRLKYFNKLPVGCKYIEIDFQPVMKKKADCIKNSYIKVPNLNFTFNNDINSSTAELSEEYAMLGIDLKNTFELEDRLKQLKVKFEVPTFFISECAVTYMDVRSSNILIKWIQSHFPNSAFIAYEQVYPNDGFGIVMRNHFDTLGCSLKSLLLYPTKEAQCERYKNMGWSSCSIMSMFEFFDQFHKKEKQRLQLLELFDEFEMWHEKCHHYILLWACQGNIMIPDAFSIKSNSICKQICSPQIKWKLKVANNFLQRFGHQVILLSSDLLLLSGGFGHINQKHQRLGGLTLCHLPSQDCFPVSVLDPQDYLSKRIFHTATKLSDSRIVILGGRSAPDKAFETVIVLDQKEDSCKKNISFSVTKTVDIPYPKWKHSASLVVNAGSESVVIFGGRSTSELATNDCYLLNSQSWHWSKIENQLATPSPRHSHSAVTFCDDKILISGGLSKNESILNSMHVLDCQTMKWSSLPISGVLPRYSHTSHYYNDHIFLVGGITNISGIPAGIGLINLSSKCALEFSLPVQDPKYPIILSNHSSYLSDEEIVIVGGGGNCFSFGTHFNCRNVTFSIKDII